MASTALYCLIVKLDVTHCACGPAKVGGHGILDHRCPIGRSVCDMSSSNGFDELLSRSVLKGESIYALDDRILEPTGGPHNWESSVPHCD